MANPKTAAITRAAPKSGWAPHNSRDRMLSQLDAATGSLTGDQQRMFADLPIEEFSTQPSTSNKLTHSDDGSVEYSGLTPNGSGWSSLASGPIVTTGAMRP